LRRSERRGCPFLRCVTRARNRSPAGKGHGVDVTVVGPTRPEGAFPGRGRFHLSRKRTEGPRESRSDQIRSAQNSCSAPPYRIVSSGRVLIRARCDLRTRPVLNGTGPFSVRHCQHALHVSTQASASGGGVSFYRNFLFFLLQQKNK
jgi:hypothetical protein